MPAAPKPAKRTEDLKYRAWIRGWLCLAWRIRNTCGGVVEAAHVRTRGARGSDAKNMVPLCTMHHREQHDMGVKSFEAKYGINLKDRAILLWTEYNKG